MPGLLSWVVTLIRDSEFEASDVFPGPRSSIRHPLSVFPSLDRVQRDQFPGFSGTMKVLRLPPVRPAALRCLRLAVPQRFTRWIRSPADECTAGAWSCSPGVSGRVSLRRRQDLPSSWGTPIVRLHMFHSDAGGAACTRPFTVQQRGPWYLKGKGSHERFFDAR